jgi:hypothetical protein
MDGCSCIAGRFQDHTENRKKGGRDLKVQPVLNIPMQLALQDPSGEYHPDAEEVSYLTTDGRELILETRTAERLNALFLRPGEAFHLCRRWDGLRGNLPRFDFWLSPASEKARAAEESAQGEGQLAASEPAAAPEPQPTAKPTRTRQRRPKVEAMPAPAEIAIHAEAEQGTGTYGPAPRLLTAPIPARLPGSPRPSRIPMNIAFREVVKFVTAELKQSGEQWSDQSRQDLVSTILISSSRQGLLDIWERP